MKNIVVYMDEKNRCRILVNPKDLNYYSTLDNASVNPENYKTFLSDGIKPENWLVINKELTYSEEKTNIGKVECFDSYDQSQKNKRKMLYLLFLYMALLALVIVHNYTDLF